MTEDRRSQRECMLLIHGLAANTLFLRPLERHFSEIGFQVFNWSYPSIRDGVERNAVRLRRLLRELERDVSIDRIHVVAHSMGGIVTRAALMDRVPSSLGRVVLLGPPSHGSPVARRLAPALGAICPALYDLSDASDSFVNRLPEPEGYNVGVIAAAYDRVVPLPNTQLVRQADHIVLPFGHGSMLLQRAVADAIHCFVDGGQFCHPSVSLFNASDRGEAERLLKLAVKKYEKTAPSLASWMEANIPDGLTVFALPASHCRRLRTTNMLERLNKEIKRRTRVATLLPNEQSLLRLASAVLIEASEDWETGKIYLSPEAE